MILPWLLFGGVVAFFAHFKRHNALDELPKWLDGIKPATKTTVTASSGRVYTVLAWRPVDGREYHVASLQSAPGQWIGYVRDSKTKERTLFKAFADSKTRLRQMTGDFNVKGTTK